MSIPKVIHYCWFGGQPLPKSVKRCIKSWKRYCPDYQIVLHNEENYDINHNLYVKQAYEAGKWAFVCDVARLEIIYEEGGIYFDTDVELIKPIDEFLVGEGFMGFENPIQIATGLGFAAKPHSEIIKRLLDDYRDISFLLEDGQFDETPCPVRNMKTLIELGVRPDGTCQEIEGFRFYSKEYFSPRDMWTNRMTHFTKNTVSIHHYDATWQSRGYRIRKRFRHIFGIRLGDFLYRILHKMSHIK